MLFNHSRSVVGLSRSFFISLSYIKLLSVSLSLVWGLFFSVFIIRSGKVLLIEKERLVLFLMQTPEDVEQKLSYSFKGQRCM